jgi:hypothetical protein
VFYLFFVGVVMLFLSAENIHYPAISFVVFLILSLISYGIGFTFGDSPVGMAVTDTANAVNDAKNALSEAESQATSATIDATKEATGTAYEQIGQDSPIDIEMINKTYDMIETVADLERSLR